MSAFSLRFSAAAGRFSAAAGLILVLSGLPVSDVWAADGEPRADAVESGDDPRPLSVPPLSQTEYPDDRPAWIEAAPNLGGAVEIWPVKSLLRPTAEEAHESLEVQMRGAVAAYTEQFLGTDRARRLPELADLYPELESFAEVDRYAGTATLGNQTVYEEAVRLRFDEPFRQRLAGQWQQAEVARRLRLLGGAGIGGLCLLLSAGGLVRRIDRHRIDRRRIDRRQVESVQ